MKYKKFEGNTRDCSSTQGDGSFVFCMDSFSLLWLTKLFRKNFYEQLYPEHQNDFLFANTTTGKLTIAKEKRSLNDSKRNDGKALCPLGVRLEKIVVCKNYVWKTCQ